MDQVLRVLLIEDSESDAMLVRLRLSRTGKQVHSVRVETEKDLRRLLGESEWDIVISDYHMPQFSAPEALAIVKQMKPDLPFIVVSGMVGEESAVAMMRHGAHDYLMKDNLARLPQVVLREVGDAAERKRAALHADHLAHTQSMILNALPANISLIDPEGVILSVNDSWKRFAYAGDWASQSYGVGTNYLEVCDRAIGRHSDQAQQAAAGIRAVLSGQRREFALEYECPSPGERRWFRLMVSPLHEHEKRGAVVMHVNITELKLAHEAMRLSEERYRRIIEVTPVPLVINDADGNITYFNPQFTCTFGYTRSDIPTLSEWWPSAYPDETYREWVKSEWMSRFRRSNDLDTPFEPMELDVRCKDGGVRTVLAEAAKLGASFDGQHLIIMYDITDRKCAERALAESEEHYRHVAAFNLRLVQEVNHRVRNNLASLLSLISMTRQRAKSLPAFASAIEDRVRSLAWVHNLMANAEWEGMNLSRMIESLIAYSHTVRGSESRVTINGPAVYLSSEQILPLASTLVELVNNSAKYGALSTSEGKLNVEWETHEIKPGKGVRMTLRWRESGGPQITGAVTRSVGTELIEGFVTHDLSGRCELRFPPTGVDHVFEFTVA